MPAIRPIALLTLLTLSCSSGTTPDTAPDPNSGDQVSARIENRASVDMDIFLVRPDQQTFRLGYVAGGETANFALPATLTAGATSISFEARPVRRSGQTIRSEPYGLRMGEIVWSISPQ